MNVWIEVWKRLHEFLWLHMKLTNILAICCVVQIIFFLAAIVFIFVGAHVERLKNSEKEIELRELRKKAEAYDHLEYKAGELSYYKKECKRLSDNERRILNKWTMLVSEWSKEIGPHGS